MPLRRLTSGGSSPPSCRYLCTASRPVKNMPLMATSSPFLSARIFSSVNGAEREIMSVKPLGDFALRVEFNALPPIRPAHITDADEERCRQTIGREYFHAEQGRLAAKAHGADAQLVRGLQHILFKRVEFRHGVAISQCAQKLFFRKFIAGGAITTDAHTQ